MPAPGPVPDKAAARIRGGQCRMERTLSAAVVAFDVAHLKQDRSTLRHKPASALAPADAACIIARRRSSPRPSLRPAPETEETMIRSCAPKPRRGPLRRLAKSARRLGLLAALAIA